MKYLSCPFYDTIFSPIPLSTTSFFSLRSIDVDDMDPREDREPDWSKLRFFLWDLAVSEGSFFYCYGFPTKSLVGVLPLFSFNSELFIIFGVYKACCGANWPSCGKYFLTISKTTSPDSCCIKPKSTCSNSSLLVLISFCFYYNRSYKSLNFF